MATIASKETISASVVGRSTSAMALFARNACGKGGGITWVGSAARCTISKAGYMDGMMI